MKQLALFALSRAHEHTSNDAVPSEISAEAKPNSRVKGNHDSLSQISNQDIENPPLHIAAYVGTETEVVHLLEIGEDVNSKGDTWGSALGAAVIGGHFNVVKILLERGANMEAHCGQYETVLEATAAGVNQDIEELLLKRLRGHHYKQ